MFYRYAILTIIFASSLRSGAAKGMPEALRMHADFPAVNKDGLLFLDVFYSADSNFTGSLQVQFYMCHGGDSMLVLDKENLKTSFKKGAKKVRVDFSETDSNTSYASNFYEILKRTGSAPPGSYKIFLSAKGGGRQYQMVYLHEIDSLLAPSSPVRQDISKSLVPKSKSFLGMRLGKSAGKINSPHAGIAMASARKKADKAISGRGLASTHTEVNGKSYVNLYYKDWFAGRYEFKNDKKFPGMAMPKSPVPAGNAPETSNDLGHPSLFSQYKASNEVKKDKNEVNGEIALATNFSNGQEQYSAQDNNYYELRGRVELPVCNMPVEMEGLYTSLDKGREVKSSYFRVHYDVEKMKSDLQSSTNSYNNKFAETKSKGTGLDQVYKSSLDNLMGQRAKLQNEINAGTAGKGAGQLNGGGLQNELAAGLEKQAKDTSGVQSQLAGKDDSSGGQHAGGTGLPQAAEAEKKEKEAAMVKKKKVDEKRRKLAELDKKIEKYKILLAQNKNTNYFDSTMGYSKTKGISNQGGMTYKQMAKRSSSLLPDGQAKGFLAGVTTMDAGMFAKDESKYTMSGQMMKGVDFGYDLGFCTAGATAGKTEYVGRDGSLNKYTFYSGKASFKPSKSQKISVIYYGYMPDTKSAGNDFFKNANISAPGFFQPVHIISALHNGSVSKYVTVGIEAAACIKNSDNTDLPHKPLADKMAYHFNVDGNIPNSPVSLGGAYDKTGSGFENNTLPVSSSGTEQYKLVAKSDFLRSFLTLGVEFDKLTQNNFASSGTNTKWGFDAKTNSKRYPNVALSYKPFTTFHSYTDTLSVPQRPLLGSVWTGKATYQVRRHQQSLRFSILYNKSTSTMDTSKYGSNLAQASVIYSGKKLTGSVSLGKMQLSGTSPAAVPATPGNTTFLSFSTNYVLNKCLSISGGQDFGVAPFGFCRYSMNGGVVCVMNKKLVARLNMRFNTYELDAGESWRQLYGGNIDLAYRFKTNAAKSSL